MARCRPLNGLASEEGEKGMAGEPWPEARRETSFEIACWEVRCESIGDASSELRHESLLDHELLCEVLDSPARCEVRTAVRREA